MKKTPRQKYMEETARMCREEWFKDHKATVLAGPPLDDAPVRIINWQQPGTWTYGVRYIVHRRWLCAVGDLGEAMYEWPQDLEEGFFERLDFGYFQSKCRASASGKDFEQFDARVGYEQALEWLAEQGGAADEVEIIRGMLDSNSSKEDIEEACQELYDINGDAELAGEVRRWFWVPHVSAVGIFVGLQAALAQLKEAKP